MGKQDSQIVSWFQPTSGRGRWRKMIGGRVFYFGQNKAEAEAEAVALTAVWRRLRRDGHKAWPENQPNREAVRTALGLDPDAATAAAVAASLGNRGSVPNTSPAPEATRRVAVRGLTLRDAGNLYLSEKAAEQVSPRTVSDTRQRLSKALTTLGKDKPILGIDQTALSAFAAHWRKPSNASLTYAKHIVSTAKAFFVWASEHDKIRWAKPNRFDSILLIKSDKPRNAAELEALKARSWGEDERFFKMDQLRLLYLQADDLMKAWLLLGLNAAYYPGDICRLRKSDVKRQGEGQAFIQTIRTKTLVKSRHPLWPETLIAIEATKGKGNHGYWFETIKHKSMDNGYGPWLIATRYEALRKEACPNAPDFKFLRHTSGNEIKKIAGGEISEVHLAHTEAFKLQSTYTDRLWEQHAAAVEKLRDVFKPMWE